MNSSMISSATIWLTGLPASGKTTLANKLCKQLRQEGKQAVVLDGDALRKGLSADLDFSEAARHEHVRRVGALACVLNAQGVNAIVSLISPYQSSRDAIRQLHHEQSFKFIEVFVDTPLSVCIERDPKGLYAKALAGEIANMTGISAPYEAPLCPEIHLLMPITIDDALRQILQKISSTHL